MYLGCTTARQLQKGSGKTGKTVNFLQVSNLVLESRPGLAECEHPFQQRDPRSIEMILVHWFRMIPRLPDCAGVSSAVRLPAQVRHHECPVPSGVSGRRMGWEG